MEGAATKDKNSKPAHRKNGPVSIFRYYLGMTIATCFCAVYIGSPLYMLAAITSLLCSYPTKEWSYIIAAPLLLSILTKTKEMNWLVKWMAPMVDYFDYEEEFECSNEELREHCSQKGKRFIFATQPHGVISFCGICAAINTPPDTKVPTAAASAVLHTPIIKNVMGIFNLIDASSSSIRKHLKNDGVEGCLVLYVGGIAELFKSSRKEERLYLSKRKGFIKIALREGVDVVPSYMFGNTSVLTVVKNGPLATLSRRLQVSLTYFWGRYYLPIPRDEKLIYARGKPLGLPHIPEPTDEDVNKWHAKYCEEVTRLFDKYKEKLPMYKHKTLYID